MVEDHGFSILVESNSSLTIFVHMYQFGIKILRISNSDFLIEVFYVLLLL